MLNGFCNVAEHPLMLTALKEAILKKKKVALPTISSWHHKKFYRDDHLGVLQCSSIRTRRFL